MNAFTCLFVIYLIHRKCSWDPANIKENKTMHASIQERNSHAPEEGRRTTWWLRTLLDVALRW